MFDDHNINLTYLPYGFFDCGYVCRCAHGGEDRMKVRVSVIGYADARAQARDATLTFDATSTVGEVARMLVRGGAGDPRLLPSAVERFAPLTLRVRYPDGRALILDAGDAAAESGLIAGAEVEPV